MILSKENTFIISLPERKYDRLDLLTAQMDNYNLGYTVWPAIRNECGVLGLLLTMENLFRQLLSTNMKEVWILEDDCDFIASPDIITAAIDQLPHDFDLLYFGSYLIRRPDRLYSKNLIQVNGAYSTHSILYSRQGMEYAYAQITKQIKAGVKARPYDQALVNTIQKMNQCYHSFPAVMKQRHSYSDIENKPVDYDKYHDVGFLGMTGHLSAANRP